MLVDVLVRGSRVIAAWLWQRSIRALAVFHPSSGSVPSELWQCSIRALAVFHPSSGSVPSELW
jgi:hypothetical protein